jgi:putative sigma-54 modulation protein
MTLIIHGKNLGITESLKEYIEKKIKPLEIEPLEQCTTYVTLSVEGHLHLHKIEVTVKKTGSAILRAEETSDDMYTSIDNVVVKVKGQIQKLQNKNRARIDQRDPTNLKNLIHTNSNTIEEDGNYNISRKKTIELKPVDIEEAILQMNMLDHTFHLFINAETHKTEIVYKRKNGSFGWITN